MCVCERERRNKREGEEECVHTVFFWQGVLIFRFYGKSPQVHYLGHTKVLNSHSFLFSVCVLYADMNEWDGTLHNTKILHCVQHATEEPNSVLKSHFTHTNTHSHKIL